MPIGDKDWKTGIYSSYRPSGGYSCCRPVQSMPDRHLRACPRNPPRAGCGAVSGPGGPVGRRWAQITRCCRARVSAARSAMILLVSALCAHRCPNRPCAQCWRSRKARAIVGRDVLNCLTSSTSEGRRSPSLSFPDSISARTCSKT